MIIALTIGFVLLLLAFVLHCLGSHARIKQLTEDLGYERALRRDLDRLHWALRYSFEAYKAADVGTAKKINERLDGLEGKSVQKSDFDRDHDGLSIRISSLASAVAVETQRLQGRMSKLESLTKPLADAVDKAKAEGKREAGKGSESPFVGITGWAYTLPNR